MPYFIVLQPYSSQIGNEDSKKSIVARACFDISLNDNTVRYMAAAGYEMVSK